MSGAGVGVDWTLLGVVLLGGVHGAEPGHGWPVAASYALDRSNKWLSGLLAGIVIGVGHLISSLAVVAGFYLVKHRFELAQFNDPVTVAGVALGGPIDIAAGLLLVALGVREYVVGHDHSHGQSDGHSHDHSGDHPHDHSHDHDHPHDRGSAGMAVEADRGLRGLAGFAFLLGFAHEEEFELVAVCSGTGNCLALALAYSLAVVAAIVGLTLLLVAGYRRYEDRVERLSRYFPLVSAVVLSVMGVGFVAGVF